VLFLAGQGALGVVFAGQGALGAVFGRPGCAGRCFWGARDGATEATSPTGSTRYSPGHGREAVWPAGGVPSAVFVQTCARHGGGNERTSNFLVGTRKPAKPQAAPLPAPPRECRRLQCRPPSRRVASGLHAKALRAQKNEKRGMLRSTMQPAFNLSARVVLFSRRRPSTSRAAGGGGAAARFAYESPTSGLTRTEHRAWPSRFSTCSLRSTSYR
jgi:hypothetical protein